MPVLMARAAIPVAAATGEKEEEGGEGGEGGEGNAKGAKEGEALISTPFA